ncbi:MAG TPA: phosphoglucosamine mutase, partial [Blastocatellia bacterium]|nr:phosphoglucosamine mutase [Blastocatellia bacterium]
MSQGAARRLFGTDGIRGKAGDHPLDAGTVEWIGRSLAVNLARDLGRPPALIIGRDTRESGPEIEGALARGAAAAGARVESCGVLTTPGVAFVTRSALFDAGVVISASHNPYTDNGIKVFSPSGKKLADEMERRIEADLDGARPPEETAEPFLADHIAQLQYRDQYIQYLSDEVGKGLSLRGIRLALDCANGAASEIAPQVFTSLGAEVDVIAASPDGRNINKDCGSLHPEYLQRLVIERGLDLGVAFDGDADRALFVDAQGELVDGDHVLLILAEYMKERGLLKGSAVVATVMSNIGLEIALRERGIELARANVGDRYVLEELLARGANLGGEQSGHIIFPDISLAGDGIITAIEVLRAVCESGKTLAELASGLQTFPQVLVNVRVSSKPKLDTVPEIKAEMERLEREMAGRGRLLVRYSGTENLARVMVEGEDQGK